MFLQARLFLKIIFHKRVLLIFGKFICVFNFNFYMRKMMIRAQLMVRNGVMTAYETITAAKKSAIPDDAAMLRAGNERDPAKLPPTVTAP